MKALTSTMLSLHALRALLPESVHSVGCLIIRHATVFAGPKLSRKKVKKVRWVPWVVRGHWLQCPDSDRFAGRIVDAEARGQTSR